MCNSTYANGTTLIESQPFVLLLVGVTNVTFDGFSPDNLALGLNRDLSALRPQSGFEHWIFQQVVSLAVTVHGRTEAHVGQRKGMLCPYGRVLAFHQTYLSHVMDAMGGEERSKWKCTMSVWAPNSESCSRACGRLAGKSIDWIIFDLNKVRRKMLARGAWKRGVTKAMQSQIGSLEAKHEKFNEVVEKRT